MDRILFDKKPCSKAGHASFSTRKIVRVYSLYSNQGQLKPKTEYIYKYSELCGGIVLLESLSFTFLGTANGRFEISWQNFR
jgi:hypothetical protein